MTIMSAGTKTDVEIRAAGEKGRGVFALRPFQKGEIVVVGRRVGVYPQRTIYSIQVDWDVHVEMDEPAIRINHSDAPTTGVQDNPWGAFNFVALREIAMGEEITFDYETTESELTDDFRACCPPSRDKSAAMDFTACRSPPAKPTVSLWQTILSLGRVNPV